MKDLFSCSFMKLGGSGRLENKDIWKDSFVFGKCEEVRIVCQSQSLEEYINSRGIPCGQHFVFSSLRVAFSFWFNKLVSGISNF